MIFGLTNRDYTVNKLTQLTLCCVLAAGITSAQTKPQVRPDPVVGHQSSVARGKYIVESVAMCEQCHTPRDENGNIDREKWLMGGPVQLKPTYPAPKWAISVPRIAGDPPGTDADFIKLVTTGIARTGLPPNPPMPRFHMTREDAEAVLAYLKQLGR